ncbi:abortive infection family protein [Francisellaceae bacterium CB300]
MKDLIKLISNSELDFIKHLYVYTTNIENNKDEYPDVVIESCRSLIECISRNIAIKLSNGKYTNNSLKSSDFSELVKKCFEVLDEKSDNFNIELVKRSNSIVHYLNERRNLSGDISHGKYVPKENTHFIQESNLAIRVTESIAIYLLENYLEIFKDDSLEYESHKDFNEHIDEIYDLPNSLSYSEALFYQDYDAYIDELDKYRELE